MIVLAGDIGGTYTRLQLVAFNSTKEIKLIKRVSYNNSAFPHLYAIIAAFFSDSMVNMDMLASACFGIAGPNKSDSIMLTNLPWVITVAELKRILRLEKVELINDFVAIGYGLEALGAQDLLTLQEGEPSSYGVKAYIGAGTGLGVGFVTLQQESYLVHPTEGGHIDFAPTSALQIELFTYLYKKFPRVSLERVLSGAGLVNIYHFLRSCKLGDTQENEELRFLFTHHPQRDLAATVTEYALKHQDPLAMQALELFINIYGATVGNLALTTLPYGGLYIVGGIVLELLPLIKGARFFRSFSAKGRMTKLMQKIPLQVVLAKNVGLQGATLYAQRLAK